MVEELTSLLLESLCVIYFHTTTRNHPNASDTSHIHVSWATSNTNSIHCSEEDLQCLKTYQMAENFVYGSNSQINNKITMVMAHHVLKLFWSVDMKIAFWRKACLCTFWNSELCSYPSKLGGILQRMNHIAYNKLALKLKLKMWQFDVFEYSKRWWQWTWHV